MIVQEHWVTKSLESYVKASLTLAPIKFMDLDFNTANKTEWYEFNVLTVEGRNHRADMDNEDWLLNIGCWSKTMAGGNATDKTPKMVTEVRFFFDQARIPIHDHDTGGVPIVARLLFGPVSRQRLTQAVPRRPGSSSGIPELGQTVCTVTGRINQ